MILPPSWTPAIYDLVETLTCRVRVLSLRHIQTGWNEHFNSYQSAVQTVERLVKANILEGDVWNIPQTPISQVPLCHWNPGQSQPDFVPIETTVRNRWDRPLITIPVVAATHQAARLFGSSSGGLPPDNHQNHDLLLSEVYLRYRIKSPTLSESWLGEDAVSVAEKGVKNPDAFLFNERGEVARVIESAGRYSLEQLESFHQHCESAELPYELW